MNTAADDYAGRHDNALREGFGSLQMLVEGVNQAMIQAPRRTVREIYSDIRDLENDRQNARPSMLPRIGIALEILDRELREMRGTAGDGDNADEN